MLAKGEKIAVIAGSGAFPIAFAQAARQNGHHVTAIAIQGFASPDLADHVDGIYWIGAGQVDTLIALCQQNDICHVTMAGKIEHLTLFNLGKVEPRASRILGRLTDRRAESLLGALAGELESEKIRVLDSSLFLASLIAGEGLLTKNRPVRPREERDIEFGWRLAREIARLDIGQSIVVKERVVIAVEAAEGTDSTIRRGGQLAGPGAVVVKVSRPRQDVRFDLPVVGLNTVRTMADAGCSALAICAGQTLFFDQEQAVELAEKSDIAIIARPGGEQVEPSGETSPTAHGE
ncbi:UDP-2,3-diacylglucosamine diphosphatase LpxI [Candidatus Sumerlaeota bacterium]|nr:UDP-2,3-diacylglucosamine diphosphatase LpxI [Candidatus Sumerlaeota bacterium]